MEDLLRTHPLIKDCRVVDVPDSRSGQLPRALVVRRDKNLTEQDVKDFVKMHLAEYKQLRGGVEFVEELLDAMCA
ncbi:Protein ACS-14 [Aphelenchoides avenae]|nr:Protein ACS-14 [Aphelenchus avenae]KAH7705914.1 Protein ACS-14 [Aphelenchus avenae]